MTIKPISDNVLIQFEITEKMGKIFLPEEAKKSNKIANVIAVGEGRTLEGGTMSKMSVKVGDTVVLREYAQVVEVKNEGNTYQLVSEREILAIITPEVVTPIAIVPVDKSEEVVETSNPITIVFSPVALEEVKSEEIPELADIKI